MNAPSIYRTTGSPLNLNLRCLKLLERHHCTDHEDLLVLPLGLIPKDLVVINHVKFARSRNSALVVPRVYSDSPGMLGREE